MSKHKSNVNPGHYKVAGRERQGEDVLHDLNKAMLAESRANLQEQGRFEERTAANQGGA